MHDRERDANTCHVSGEERRRSHECVGLDSQRGGEGAELRPPLRLIVLVCKQMTQKLKLETTRSRVTVVAG
jgi:hypothetical protein